MLTIDELRKTGVIAETLYCPTCDGLMLYETCPFCWGSGIHKGFVYTGLGGHEPGEPCACEQCNGVAGFWFCPKCEESECDK
jgi:hypothetical protein